MTPRFARFAAIDWSGAKGARHKGIAIALCETGQAVPRLIPAPGGIWSRQAVVQCLAAKDAYEFLGSPEGELAIVQACIYCATAPKSNAGYMAMKASFKSARDTGSLMPPMNIVNAPTKLMKQVGYGKGYQYDHDADQGFSGANYWPEEMTPQTFYQPIDRGFEARIAERIAHWNRLRAERGPA